MVDPAPEGVDGLDVAAFLAELVLLVALGVAGWRLVDPVAGSIALALALPGLLAVVWGQWLAPKARRRLPNPVRAYVKVLICGLVGVALALVAPLWSALVVGTGGAAVLAWHEMRGHPSSRTSQPRAMHEERPR